MLKKLLNMKKNYKIVPSFIDRFDLYSANMSINDYKNTVLRDLSFLLSSFAHLRIEDIEESCDRVKSSVLAYGVHPFIGDKNTAYKENMAEEVRSAILKFEPRIKPETLVVEEPEREGINYKLLIKGDLIAPTETESINLTLNIDIETGHSTVSRK